MAQEEPQVRQDPEVRAKGRPVRERPAVTQKGGWHGGQLRDSGQARRRENKAATRAVTRLHGGSRKNEQPSPAKAVMSPPGLQVGEIYMHGEANGALRWERQPRRGIGGSGSPGGGV